MSNERPIDIARRHWQDYVEDHTYSNANCCTFDYEDAYADMERQRDEYKKQCEELVTKEKTNA